MPSSASFKVIIFVRVHDAFLYILYYGQLKKSSNCIHQYEKIMTLTCVHLIHFPFSLFSSHWSEEKLDTWFFHSQSVSNWRYVILCRGWDIFYVMTKTVFLSSSPFSFHILQCQIQTLRQTCCATDDRLLIKVSGIVTLYVACDEIIFWLLLQNLSCGVNLVNRLVYILHDFCVEIVRWGPTFQLIFLCEYFTAGQISSVLYHHLKYTEDDDHRSFVIRVKRNV